MLDLIEVVLGLLAAVAALTLLARKLRIPSPILLVAGGLLLSLIPKLPTVNLSPDLVFLIFLPPLLYPAALFTSWRDFQANLRPITMLAVGLVLFTTVVVGFLTHYFIPELPIAIGFLLGALISPPDAVAAMAITRGLSVPRRIIAVLEGESLVNDATALVAYRFALAALVTGSFSLSHAIGRFFVVAIGGILVGLVIGWIVAWIEKPLEDPPVEITISLLTPFAVYLTAEKLGVSPVLAVVAAGLFQGWWVPEITSARTRLQAIPVWEMVEFLLNGFVFILIGLQLRQVMASVAGLPAARLAWYATGLCVAVILVRIVWVYPATYLPRLLFPSLRKRDPYPSWRNVAIVGWTGIRGVVSLAAALALPLTLEDGRPFPGRDLVIFLTFVVILATLVIQGLSLPLVIRWLGIKGDHEIEREEHLARLKANQAALGRLLELEAKGRDGEEVFKRVRVEYEDRIRQLEAEKPESEEQEGRQFDSEYEKLSRQLLKVERATILKLRNELVINDAALRRIQRDLDLAEARLRRTTG